MLYMLPGTAETPVPGASASTMIWNIAFAFALFVSASSSENFPIPSTQTAFLPRDDTVNYRLPTDTVPVRYDITVEPIFYPDFVFNGEVTILIEVKEVTSLITLHGNELTLETVTVTPEIDSTTPISTGFTQDTVLHFIYISLDSSVSVGTRLNVYIKYQGILNERNEGFYRASYEENGVTKWFGTTQFQATNAREAFPCYDEPALKAIFKINIIRPAEYFSISNMELLNTEETTDGKFKDIYQDSVVMSSYLVAFVVSEFSFVEQGNQRVYGAPELINDQRGDYGLEVGIQTLAAMEEFVGIYYHLNKLYQVAIPDGWFWAGAMENWGLITYRERYILYKEGLSTASEKQFVALVIAHELGHQWFGNLVSPTWWEYLWLSEGFATYFEYYATDAVDPDFRMMDQYLTYAYQSAMEYDALITTRPMSYDVQSPEEIISIFDHIAYNKAGAVIRMMEHFLSTSVFRRGLYRYLTDMAFGAATPSDLWDGLQTSADLTVDNGLQGLTVAEIMETWSNTAGYPVVYVKRVNGAIVLSQFRFLLLDDTNELESPWIIPINYATSASPNFEDTSVTYWLKSAEETTDIEISDSDWIILNKQSTGFYRINYEEDNWNLIINYLKSNNFNNIQLLNRAQLIDDALNLARSGRLDYSIAMDLLVYLSQETDYIPLQSFFTGLTFLNRHFVNSDNYDIFKRFVREILQTVYDDLGTEDTGSHADKLNRVNVLTWMCRFDHEGCLKSMHEKMISGDIVAPDLQVPVYCGGLITEDADILKWLMLYGRYNGNNAESLERGRIVDALGCTRSTTLINRLLDAIVGIDNYLYLSSADRRSAFAGIYTSSKIGLDTAFTYLTDNFDSVRSTLSTPDVSTMITGISQRLTTPAQKTQLDTFIASLTEDVRAEYNTALTTASSNVQSNIDWADEHLDSITTWLIEYYADGSPDSSGFVTVSIPLLAAGLLSHIFQN